MSHSCSTRLRPFRAWLNRFAHQKPNTLYEGGASIGYSPLSRSTDTSKLEAEEERSLITSLTPPGAILCKPLSFLATGISLRANLASDSQLYWTCLSSLVNLVSARFAFWPTCKLPRRAPIPAPYTGSKSSSRQYKFCQCLISLGLIVSLFVVLPSVLGDPAKSLHPFRQIAISLSCGVSLTISVIAEIRLSPSLRPTDCNFSFRVSKKQNSMGFCQGHQQDGALWWFKLPRDLLENILNCERIRCLNALFDISTSFVMFLSKALFANREQP
jgi:hypothetical protein